MAKTGSIGYVGIIPPHMPICRISRDIIAILPKPELSSEFLALFLQCNYGLLQLFRVISQQVQPHLEIEMVNEILVPIPTKSFHDYIIGAVRKAEDLRTKSRKLFYNAQDKLLDLACLSNWQPPDAIYFTDKYGMVAQSHRIDAEHYQPKFKALLKHLNDKSSNRYGVCRLSDIASVSEDVEEPFKNPNTEIKYIELKNIDSDIGIIKEAMIVKGSDAPSRARMSLRHGDIIASSVEGSLAKVALVDKKYDKSIGSTGFVIIRPKNGKSLSEYLLVLIKSKIVQLQFEKEITGTILTSFSKGIVDNVTVPDIPMANQKIIADLVRAAHSAFAESRTLIVNARKRVENYIDEKAAVSSKG